MLRVFRIVGMALSLLGAVWGLQGIGLLHGSPMTGQSFWAGAGIVVLLVGVSLVYLGMRPRQA